MNYALVTAGAGFIGSNLCLKLLNSNYKVIAVDNLITSTGKNLSELSKNPNFTFFKQDIKEPLDNIIRSKLRFNVIYHLACPTGVPNIKSLGEEMLFTCSIGTKNILDLALVHNAKLLFTSSSEVYGDPLVFPQNEKYNGNVDCIGYRSPYEEGKRFSESIIVNYVKKYCLDAKIVRIFNTYGPGMSKDDTRVIPRFINQIAKNKPLLIEGDGMQTRTFCYINDLINGLLLIMEKGIKGHVYNLGSDQEIAIKDLARIMLKLKKTKSKIVRIKRPSHDHNRRLPSLDKVKQIGWEPTTKLIDGLSKTFLWYGL